MANDHAQLSSQRARKEASIPARKIVKKREIEKVIQHTIKKMNRCGTSRGFKRIHPQTMANYQPILHTNGDRT